MLALLLLASSDTPSPKPAPGKGGGGGGGGGKLVPMVKSFEPTTIPGAPPAVNQWVTTRLAVAQEQLEAIAGDNPAVDVDEVALSVVAHWAIETNWGASEFNFNVGNIDATAGQPAFAYKDAHTGVMHRGASYASLEDGAKAYADLLWNRYRAATMQLLQDPETPDWYVSLGKAGYFEATSGAAALMTSVRAKVASLATGGRS